MSVPVERDMPNPMLSTVIRCYNEEHIGRPLSCIAQQTVQDREIIIVDSGPTDATQSIASRYPVKILSIRPEEFSFYRSLKLHCQAASGEFIVIASTHVYPVYRDGLEQIIDPSSDPTVALDFFIGSNLDKRVKFLLVPNVCH
jgi:rhamnosyltransferase